MKRILLLFIALAAVWGAAAKIRLPEIIGNDMVLQQNAEVRLWGWAEPYAAVKVETSWGAGAAVKSDAEGRWVVSVRTPAGSYEPQRITFASGDRVTFDRVLIGEVWFAGGQSNMEMPLGGFWQCPVTDANEIIARAGAKSGKLHYVKIPHAAAYMPQDRTAGSWTPCMTATAAKFTAAGYFFAEMLNDVLGVPVGIIDCSWGGSRVESWMSREVLSGYSDIDLTEEGISRVAQHLRPMVMYNAMLRPVAGYTVRGFLWYQGESNAGRYMDYAARLFDMVSLWRGLWGRDDLPFYYVEIAPFEYGNGKSPYLREAQCRAQELIPNSGMICAEQDLRDEGDRLPKPAVRVDGDPRRQGPCQVQVYGSGFQPDGRHPRIRDLRRRQGILSGRCGRRKPVRSGRFVGESAGTRGRALLLPRFPAGQSGRYPRTAGRSFPYGRFLSLLTVGIAGPGL